MVSSLYVYLDLHFCHHGELAAVPVLHGAVALHDGGLRHRAAGVPQLRPNALILGGGAADGFVGSLSRFMRRTGLDPS